MDKLPSRLSIGTIRPVNYFPNEENQALSLPHTYYISLFACWENSGRDNFIREWLRRVFGHRESVSVGQHIADFDAKQRVTKVRESSPYFV